MIITSPSFNDGDMIPKKFTCDGGNINPELLMQNVPSEAQSLALILHDSDAPTAGGFTHWAVWNIDPETTVIKEESIPPGSAEGTNDGNRIGYFGPCPPPGAAHHYHFQLYALDAPLDLPEGGSAAALRKEMEGHIIAAADLTGRYGRDKNSVG